MMKAFSMLIVVIVFGAGFSGCGKTLGELRANGDAIVDNGTAFVEQTTGTVGTLVKKVLSVGFAIYDLGKNVVADTIDNGGTVIKTVTGADQTPTGPATK